MTRATGGYQFLNLVAADAYLHAHVWPRYDWEPVELVGGPVWLYPSDRWRPGAEVLGPAQDSLRMSIAKRLG